MKRFMNAASMSDEGRTEANAACRRYTATITEQSAGKMQCLGVILVNLLLKSVKKQT